MSKQQEFCDECRATVFVYRSKGNIICENCDRPLFDCDGNEIVTQIQKAIK